MRALLIILVTIALIAGGFFVVLKSQKASPRQATTTSGPAPVIPATRPSDTPDPQQMVGQGERVWVQSFDSKTGDLSHEFYAEKYDPQGGDAVDVTAPQARFYLGRRESRQMLVIKGTQGRVIIPNTGGRNRLQGGATSAPTRGELQQVSIELFGSPTDSSPQIVCTMPNAAFDNDQFRIYTEGYRDGQGNLIAADQVPVTVRGKYEFDGKGLEIRWNERDRRLQSLEIAHGDKLVIHDVETLKLSAAGIADLVPLAEALATTDPAVAGEVIAQATQPTTAKKKKKPKPTRISTNVKIERDESTPIFRATLYDNVMIFENESQIGQADRLFADFILSFSSKPATTQPTTQAARPDAPVEEEPKPRPRARRDDNDAIKGPIIVRWTGKLRVEPTEDPNVALPRPEQFNVALQGEPARLFRNGAEIVGSLVSWRSGDGAFQVDHSSKTPQVMLRDARGATIWTESIEYGGVGHTAVLTGKSRAQIPIPADGPDAKPQTVDATWNDTCQIELTGDSFDALQINKAELEGRVTLKHPQISGQSDILTLEFDASVDEADKDALGIRQLVAAGGADYAITDSHGQKQSIQTDRLQVVTARDEAGQVYPASVEAQGNVHTLDAERELFASQLSLKLHPLAAEKNKRRQIDLESLLAEGKVRVITPDGQRANADRLTVTTQGETRQLELIGVPHASIGDKDAELLGPNIRIDPDSGSARVVGAGSLWALHKPSADAKPQRINVTWETDLQLDGPSNLATLHGPVTVSIPDDAGTENSASAKKMLIVLTDNPTSQPADGSARALRSSSAFTGKSVKSYQLLENVELKSILSDAAGAMLRRMHLFTARLDYDQLAQRLTIPGAGRMLVQDNRKPDQPDGESELFARGRMRGSTAFEWQKELSYDESKQLLEMIGGVRIVHQGEGNAEPFDVTAEKVSAEIQPDGGDPTAADKVQVRRLSASGAVNFVSKRIRFVADEVIYDPQTHQLTARAGGSNGAELFQEDGDSRGSFSELIFDTNKNEIVSMKGFRASVRR